MVYAIHILVIMIFKFCKVLKKQSMLEKWEILVHSMAAFQDNYLIASKRHDSL
jgi:hypothetical protein